MKIRLDLSKADLDVDEDDPEIQEIIAEVQAEADEQREEEMLGAYRPTKRRGAWLTVIEGGGETTPHTGDLRSV